MIYVNNIESTCDFSSQYLFNDINDVSTDEQLECSVDSLHNRDRSNIQDSMQKSFVSFIAKLQARSDNLLTNAQFITEGVKELLQDSLQLTLEHVRSVFNELNIDENVTCIQNLYKDLATVTTCINKVDTEHKLIAYLKIYIFLYSSTASVSWSKEREMQISFIRKLQNERHTGYCSIYSY